MDGVQEAIEGPAATVADGVLGGTPRSEHRDALGLFGQFVGRWVFDSTYFADEGPWHGSGTWDFAWALDGRAVIDAWRLTHVAGALVEEGPPRAGMTVRIYDPERGSWHSAWCSGTQPAITRFEARAVGDEIVLEEVHPEPGSMRWIFSDVTETSFSWRAVMLEPDGSWRLRQRMSVRRRS